MDVFWSVRGRVVDTRKVILARVDVGEHPLAPKEPSWSRSPTRMGRRTAIDGGLALTFGTLLSSQESDAHRASDFRLKLRGNSPNFTVSSGAGQIGLFRPSFPA